MPDYKIFDEIAKAYLTALDAVTSPWPLILLASVFAIIWLYQVIGCAVDSLDGEVLLRVCKEPDGLYQSHWHGELDDGKSELLLIEHQLGADLKPSAEGLAGHLPLPVDDGGKVLAMPVERGGGLLWRRA